MNDRINELFDKALNEVIPNTWTNLNMDQLNDIKDKFALLIIKETLQVARAGIEFGDGMEDAVYKYFGVEEK